MNKINFVNGQAPALNAQNLNQLQKNIENEIQESGIVVSPTEPNIERKKVWIQKGKNSFNPDDYTQGNAQGYILKEKLIVGESYTISFNNSKGKTHGVIITTENGKALPADGFEKYSTTGASFIYTQAMYEKNYHLFIINITAYSTLSKEEIIDLQVQLEQGLTGTEYEEYIEPKIYIKNDNNVYEELNKNNDMIKSKVLWSNTYVKGVPFEAQTIKLNSSDYDYLEWYFRDDKTIRCEKTIKGVGVRACKIVGEGEGSYVGFRFRDAIYENDISYSIGNGCLKSVNSNAEAGIYNTILVPVLVVGYKS